MSERIVQNLMVLIQAVEDYPEPKLDLGIFKLDRECGTIYCTAGLAASLPIFQQQGLTLLDRPFPIVTLNGYGINQEGGDKPLAELFGESAFCRLFSPRHGSPYDAVSGLVYQEPPVSDKQIALNRLRFQLDLYNQDQ